jgi:hypothetical protein
MIPNQKERATKPRMIQLKINDQITNIPAELADITLGQFVAFWDKHGREFDKQLAVIEAEKWEDPFLKEIAMLELENNEAVAWYSYFTGYDFATIKGAEADILLSQYRIIRENLAFSEMAAYKLPNTIHWKEAEWTIKDWKITPSSDFTFNELLTSKEITRQIYAIGKGKWEALPYLCAVFLRKENESFEDWMVEEGSERLAMMHELSMDYALQVAFFLTSSVVTLWTASLFSKVVEERQIQTLQDTTTAGVG